MGAPTKFILGGQLHLQASQFQWEFYRGTSPKPMVAIIPTERADEAIAFVNGLTAGETSMTIESPNRAGPNPEAQPREIQGVFIERVVKVNPLQTRIVMYDRRLILARRIMDLDFNLSFGDGFLNDTRAATYSAAIRQVAASIDVLLNNLASDAFTLIPNRTYNNPDLLSGFPLADAFGQLLDAANVDLTVTKEGKFKFVDRKDIRDATLPDDSVDWYERPSWVSEDNITLTQLPRQLFVQYRERHCIRVENNRTNRTRVGFDPELDVELEQVYAARGAYFTLPDLLEEFGFARDAITDTEIAATFMTDTFQSTAIEADGTVETQELIKAIKDGWRMLWRINFPEAQGHLGGWEDWDFGKLLDDGAVDPVPVECQWVEFLNVIDVPNGGTFEGSKASVNHPVNASATPTAPFAAQWDNGPENRVIRLKQQELRDGNLARPGRLSKDLVVEAKPNISDEAGIAEWIANGFRIIESEDRGKAKFFPSFKLVIFMVATRRLPNNETRYHLEKVDARPNGQVDYFELPVTDDILCLRDYVESGNPQKFASSDGFGTVLNNLELHDDAERRAELWLQLFTSPIEGEGVAERLDLLDSFEVQGAVNFIRIERNGAVVRTRIGVGNLADGKARQKKADKRRILNQRKEAGKVVV